MGGKNPMTAISIVIPTFNRPQLLKRLLLSIEAQTYRNFEVIVIDDGTPLPNENMAIIQSFNCRLPQLHYHRMSASKGAPHCRNYGIKKARHPFIALVDDDDTWKENKLERQLEAMNKASAKVGLIYTWTEVLNEKDELLYKMTPSHEGKAISSILNECFIPSPSVFFRKSALDSIGGFDERLPSCQDWETWIRFFKAGHECLVIKEFLTNYYKHTGPSIGTSPKSKMGYLMVYKKHWISFLQYYKFRHLVRFFKLWREVKLRGIKV